jgi:hypothetical protein
MRLTVAAVLHHGQGNGMRTEPGVMPASMRQGYETFKPLFYKVAGVSHDLPFMKHRVQAFLLTRSSATVTLRMAT